MVEENVKPQVARRTRNPRKKAKRNRGSDIVKWWFGTVFLTLFPTLLTLVVGILRGITITIELLIANGELILSAFTIVTSTLISSYNKRKNSTFEESIFYTLLMICPLELVCYAVIKTNNHNNLCMVIFVSLISLLTSILISWVWYYLMNKKIGGDNSDR